MKNIARCVCQHDTIWISILYTVHGEREYIGSQAVGLVGKNLTPRSSVDNVFK